MTPREPEKPRKGKKVLQKKKKPLKGKDKAIRD